MQKTTRLAPQTPAVCRLGLATRGNTHLGSEDVEWAISRGVNYLNWCGHPDGMSRAIAGLGDARKNVVVAVQLEARSAADAGQEFAAILEELQTGYVDVLTLYYVETQQEWEEILAPEGAWNYLAEQKRLGRLKMIGLTSHQRQLAAGWAGSGRLDLLMVRYNAAHQGATKEVLPAAAAQGIPVVTFTGLRWKALLEPTPCDPPGFVPPTAADCYRFCLAKPGIAVVLTAPGCRKELEQNLALLDDWRPPAPAEWDALSGHGDRVRRHAGVFW